MEEIIAERAKTNQVRTAENRVSSTLTEQEKVDTREEVAKIVDAQHEVILQTKKVCSYNSVFSNASHIVQSNKNHSKTNCILHTTYCNNKSKENSYDFGVTKNIIRQVFPSVSGRTTHTLIEVVNIFTLHFTNYPKHLGGYRNLSKSAVMNIIPKLCYCVVYENEKEVKVRLSYTDYIKIFPDYFSQKSFKEPCDYSLTHFTAGEYIRSECYRRAIIGVQGVEESDCPF